MKRVRGSRSSAVALSAVAVLVAGCGGTADGQRIADGQHTADVQPAAQVAAGVVVDSIFPMEVMIDRFQTEAGPAPQGLGDGGAESRDALVRAFVSAVEDSSAASLSALRMDMAEYAHLYFPDSHLARAPYRQPPAMGWMLTEQNGLKGEARVLRQFGGGTLGFRGYECPSEPVREGRNTLWQNCTVDVAVRAAPLRLFGTIIERDGRFKFISVANDL